MSRSGYSDDLEPWDLIRWRGAVASAIKGKRGQAFLKEMAAALDEMPEKRLIDGALEFDGDYCALGVLGKKRGLDMEGVDPEEADVVAELFGIAPALAKEVVFMNDDDFCWTKETPEQRWLYMRRWVGEQIQEA